MILIFTFLTMISGFGMFLTIENIYYSEWFAVWYSLSEIVDYAGNLIGNKMAYEYMELESRGITLSIISTFMTLVAMPLNDLNAYVNSAFHIEDPTTHKSLPNYPLGSSYTILIGYSIMAIYWLIIFGYRIILWKRGE
jgi:hypothetical protein